MFAPVRVLGVASSLALLAVALFADEKAGEPTSPSWLPRYGLKVGRQFEYEANSSYKSELSETQQVTELLFLVLATNDDGSCRIVVSERTWLGRGKEPIAKDAQRARATLAYFDLYADGRVVGAPEYGYVHRIFPRLPEDERKLAAGWSAEGIEAATRRYELESQEDDRTRFAEVDTGRLLDFFQFTVKTTYDFDHRRGLIDRALLESSRGVRPATQGTSECKLVASEVLSGEAISKLADETRAYFDAVKDYEKRMKQAAKDPERSENISAEAKGRLQLAASPLTVPMLKAQAVATLAGHDVAARRAGQEAERRAKIVGREAVDWETIDLDGRPFSLKGLRGKVVVLDFWYRACEPCIRAMVRINETARFFRGKSVAVVGMNTDHDIADAKYVVEKLGLEYTNVRAEGAAEKFHVGVFPGVIVIDRKGIVRSYHEGAAPTLGAELNETINALLAEP